MPTRLVREGINSSPKVAQLKDWGSEVFYRRLINVVDDYGCFTANPTLLRAACYPLLIDRINDAQIETWLADAQRCGLLRLYEASGQKFVNILNFNQQVRAKNRKYPDPDSDGSRVLSTSVADAKQPPPAHKRGNGKHPIGNWQPGENETAWAKRNKFSEKHQSLAFNEMKDWALSNGKMKSDWAAAWRNWLRKMREQGNAPAQEWSV